MASCASSCRSDAGPKFGSGDLSDSDRSASREGGTRSVLRHRELQHGLHPAIEAKARPQFLIGEYEQGVFTAMKAIEIRVRKLGGFPADTFGVDLMNEAFGPKGPLRDPTIPKGEQEGMRALFVGAYAVLRNPAGHRDVDYDDVSEASEAVHTASMLMRILDRLQHRLKYESLADDLVD
jgi:uncharacterized protein (TIGR02391 family)